LPPESAQAAAPIQPPCRASATTARAAWRWTSRSSDPVRPKQEQLDAASISADNCCPQGKCPYGRLKAYSDCIGKHAQFHREAGLVAHAINQKQFSRAEAMLGPGTPYATAAGAVSSAILGLKKEAAIALASPPA